MKVEAGTRAMAVHWKTKALVTPPPRWVWVSAWQQLWRCNQNLCRPFLQAGRFH